MQISDSSLVELVLSLQYSTDKTRHTDHFYCGDVNMWRDVFTHAHRELLLDRRSGENVTLADNHCFFPEKDQARKTILKKQWQPPPEINDNLEPRIGRWYPQGYLRGLTEIFPQTKAPFRVTDITADHLTIDCNHPLAAQEIRVEAQIEEVAESHKERGGRCTDWISEALANGPGMQLFLDNDHVDYGEPLAFKRQKEEEDIAFFNKPRFVDHIDSTARSALLQHTSSLITEDMKILDLMSSVQSHLPGWVSATGLGLNAEELSNNPRLTDFVVHDLNNKPILPFTDGQFDGVCCHLSFEYLLYPAKIAAECARILNERGLLLISISNRWFPEKVTRIWQMLHDFERIGYVMEYIRKDFTEIETITYRNWPRPVNDAHYYTTQQSDPLFIIVARKN